MKWPVMTWIEIMSMSYFISREGFFIEKKFRFLDSEMGQIR